MSDTPAMSLAETLEVIHHQRREAVVITTMGAAREWQQLEPHPKDFVYMPSSMGQGPPLGLGIAIAKPEQRVIVVNGDGCLLMNLGCLITITAQAPKNFTLIIIDNGVYEVTGGQTTIANAARRADDRSIDFQAMARASGFEHVYEFDDIESWRYEHEVMHDEGPTCIVLKTTVKRAEAGARSPGPPVERTQLLYRELNDTDYITN